MVVLNKRIKVILTVLAFILLVITGTLIERCEKDAFIKETVVTDDAKYTAVSSGDVDGKININSAAEDELKKLSGIGDVMAKRIVEYRTNNGPFMTIEEIMKVSGISEKKFEAIREYIRTE